MWRHFDTKQKLKSFTLCHHVWMCWFWYKTEIKIIYFVPSCLIVLIVSVCMLYLDPKFLISKIDQKLNIKNLGWGYIPLKKKKKVRVNHQSKNWGQRLILFWSYVITQGICNKFIEINFCVGCMVCTLYVISTRTNSKTINKMTKARGPTQSH